LILESRKKDFLAWLKNNNFVFLCYQECIPDEDRKFVPSGKENLGLMRASEEYQIVLVPCVDLDCLYKRFSIEGGKSAIVAIERIIGDSVALGIEEIVLGMAYRGRLSVLTKVMGKEYAAMLSEFQGNLAYASGLEVSGDVKCHLGYFSDRTLASGKKCT
jgi:hypothetical protein